MKIINIQEFQKKYLMKDQKNIQTVQGLQKVKNCNHSYFASLNNNNGDNKHQLDIKDNEEKEYFKGAKYHHCSYILLIQLFLMINLIYIKNVKFIINRIHIFVKLVSDIFVMIALKKENIHKFFGLNKNKISKSKINKLNLRII